MIKTSAEKSLEYKTQSSESAIEIIVEHLLKVQF